MMCQRYLVYIWHTIEISYQNPMFEEHLKSEHLWIFIAQSFETVWSSLKTRPDEGKFKGNNKMKLYTIAKYVYIFIYFVNVLETWSWIAHHDFINYYVN